MGASIINSNRCIAHQCTVAVKINYVSLMNFYAAMWEAVARNLYTCYKNKALKASSAKQCDTMKTSFRPCGHAATLVISISLLGGVQRHSGSSKQRPSVAVT